MRSMERPGAPGLDLDRLPVTDLERKNEVLEALLRQKQRDLDHERDLRRAAREQCAQAERYAVRLAAMIPKAPPEELRCPARIVATEGTCGGHPRLDGHRLCVHDIVSGVRNYGGDVLAWWEEEFPYLTFEQVLAALGYYAAHPAEIDPILAARQAAYEALPTLGEPDAS